MRKGSCEDDFLTVVNGQRVKAKECLKLRNQDWMTGERLSRRTRRSFNINANTRIESHAWQEKRVMRTAMVSRQTENCSSC